MDRPTRQVLLVVLPIRQSHAHQPTIAIGLPVHQFGLFFQQRIDFDHLTRHGRTHGNDGFRQFDHGDRIPLLHEGTGALGPAHVDIAGQGDAERGDADRGHAAVRNTRPDLLLDQIVQLLRAVRHGCDGC